MVEGDCGQGKRLSIGEDCACYKIPTLYKRPSQICSTWLFP